MQTIKKGRKMKEITDLENIKERAKMLLNTNIIETQMSPMFVSHPFTKSGIVFVPEGNDMVELNIAESPVAFVKWKDIMSKQIDNSSSVYNILYILNDAYLLLFFDTIEDLLSPEDYSKLLVHCWKNSEYSNCDANVSKNKLLNYFKKADKKYLLSEEQTTINSLSDKVIIYRGVTPYNKKNIRALSWTLDYNTAKWFANRFGQNGIIYSATIDKNKIYAYFNDKEQEVIVDPKFLEDIKITSPQNNPSL